MADAAERSQPTEFDLEVLVIGAGITGIYQLYKLREAGFDARLVEAAPEVGGTWYWNRYPEARFDTESYSYGFFFSKELFEEWKWSERFACQPEIERYLNHVVDRFDLRDLMTFNFRVAGMQFDPERDGWTVTSTAGDDLTARFVISAVGILSAPFTPDIPGRDRFRGEQYHTGLWPDGVEFDNRRVAVVGTGSSGIQIVPAIADRVSELFVLQRTANWATPIHNGPISDAEHSEFVANFEQFRQSLRETYSGFVHAETTRMTFDDTPAERRAWYEDLWNRPGLGKAYSNYADLVIDPKANREFCDFIAEKIRSIVKDPETAEKLIPKDHGYAMKRPPMEAGFYESFNRDNVSLVDLKATPLIEVTEKGLRTTAGDIDVDLIVWATGFDAVTGALTRMDIRSGNETLEDAWSDGPRTYLGMQISGFPNFFIVGGPATYGNAPRSTEDHVDFLTGMLRWASENGHQRIDASKDAEAEWTDHVAELASYIDFADTAWFNGSNIPGKPRRFLVYLGGLPTYRKKVEEVANAGYEGFIFGPGS